MLWSGRRHRRPRQRLVAGVGTLSYSGDTGRSTAAAAPPHGPTRTPALHAALCPTTIADRLEDMADSAGVLVLGSPPPAEPEDGRTTSTGGWWLLFRSASREQRLDMERRRLGISEAEFARNAYDRVETAQGIMYVPKRPGAPVIPIMDAAGKPIMGAGGGKPTEGELNASGFAQRMERAGSIISTLPAGAETSVGPAIAGAIPIIGGVSQRLAQSSEQQQYKQAADDWIRAKLRKESGAVIGKEEMEQEYITYFPQIGDSDSVKAQKAEARRVATEAMRTSAGRAYQPYTPPPPPVAPQEGQEAKDKSGRAIVFRNNRWEYK